MFWQKITSIFRSFYRNSVKYITQEVYSILNSIRVQCFLLDLKWIFSHFLWWKWRINTASRGQTCWVCTVKHIFVLFLSITTNNIWGLCLKKKKKFHVVRNINKISKICNFIQSKLILLYGCFNIFTDLKCCLFRCSLGFRTEPGCNLLTIKTE